MTGIASPGVSAVVALMLILTGCAAGPAASSGPSPASISRMIETILEMSGFTGAALVGREGEVLYRGAMGFADAETGRRNTPETRFKLGSIYKQLSAGLILTLARDGLLDINDSLCQGIPDCPDSLAQVTYHQVLTHTSGIGELTEKEGMRIHSNEDALRIIGDSKRLFEPGSGDSVGNWSTVDDLWAWHRALLAGDLIPSRLVALMERPAVRVDDALWYGYGVEVRETFGRREISHRGGTEGFSWHRCIGCRGAASGRLPL